MTWLDEARKERDGVLAEAALAEAAARGVAETRMIAIFDKEVAPHLPQGVEILRPLVTRSYKNSSTSVTYQGEAVVSLYLGEDAGEDRLVDLVVYQEYGGYGLKLVGGPFASDHYVHRESLARDLLAYVEGRQRTRQKQQEAQTAAEAQQARNREYDAKERQFREAVARLERDAWRHLHVVAHEALGDECSDASDLPFCEMDPWAILQTTPPDKWSQARHDMDLEAVEAQIAAAAAVAAAHGPTLKRLREKAREWEYLPKDVAVYRLTYPAGASMGEDGPEVDYKVRWALKPERPPVCDDGTPWPLEDTWWSAISGDTVIPTRLGISEIGPGTLVVEETSFSAGTLSKELPPALRHHELLQEGDVSYSYWRPVKPLVGGA